MDLSYKINKKAIVFSLGWLFIIVMPSFLMVLKLTSSFSFGLILSSFLIFSILSIFKFNYLLTLKCSKIFLFLFFVLFYMLFQYLLNNLILQNFKIIDTGRFYAGIFGFSLTFICCVYIAYYLISVNDNVFYRASKIVGSFLIINSVFSLLKIDIFNTGLAKPTLFYQEPSHFALVVAPFVIYFSLILKRTYSLFLLVFVAFWALYIQNATMIIVFLIALWISLRIRLLNLIIGLTIFISLVALLEPSSLTYYKERIILSPDSDNLSVLVLLQGWENAILTLKDNSFFGAGFQQFGVGTALGSASDKIHELIGIYLNLYDGGSLAPKLIGEFGILGVGAVIYYCFIFILSVNKIKSIDRNSNRIIIFSYCSIIGVFIDFFIRGTGYFSPSVYMFIISMFYLKFKKSITFFRG
ncbi:hypothetical protein [Photobacterium leiognathi]|uniref:hypothetical protein n=1 Tax=Photobacterium leiognathi TaxID=553611 RepID=UPI002980F626|nr:hypothetical protein [Photobacterium leiognathi]